MDRKEAIALVKELGDRELVQPTFVVIENKSPDKLQLKIKGEYDCHQIEVFLKNRGFSFQETKDFLTISKL